MTYSTMPPLTGLKRWDIFTSITPFAVQRMKVDDAARFKGGARVFHDRFVVTSQEGMQFFLRASPEWDDA